MSQIDLDQSATIVNYGQLAHIIHREMIPWLSPIPAGQSKQMSGLLITGNSGIGKTALAGAVAAAATRLAYREKRSETFPLFVWSTGGHSRYIEIPGTAGYTIPTVIDNVFDAVEQDPHAYPVLLIDEVLSSDPGFQSALQKLYDDGRMGDRCLTREQRGRLFIIATGNTRRDGNKTVQANSFYTARMGKYRLEPSPHDFLESVVRTGIVSLHPLVLDLLQSDTIHQFWLKDDGGHKCNPRVLEALSQRLNGMTDPLTGMLDTSDETQWALNRVHLGGYASPSLVTELMARNESLSTLTPISAITADPDGATLPPNTMGELMQLMLIESYMSGQNPAAAACVPHFYRFCRRMSQLVQPAVSAMVQRLAEAQRTSSTDTAAVYMTDLDDWDTTLISITLANAFREIDDVESMNIGVEGIAEITGEEENQADKRLSKKALSTDPIAEYLSDPDRYASAQMMAAMVADKSGSDTGTATGDTYTIEDSADYEDMDGIMDDLHTPASQNDLEDQESPPMPNARKAKVKPDPVDSVDELDWD